ncbi:histidine phosphatase family protein [Hymenobacter sp. DH14]|uniref:Histidine phosphatase family protein n=1 Tax=Hymenobacter cyanobacteriorum TaxID=2926463 RepID=A0A9X1VI71_9BACT|nr:phosphoglycerate mutase family protein [Hymenobacter cyanobacteriorum]MCI1187415.1 histidine phosphatase family protein [Hymenobacter cyanobacteriorum]
MNYLLTRFSALCVLLVLLATVASRAQTPATPEKVKMKIKPLITTVYIVRHAEKDTTVAGNSDPELSAEGRARAQALNQTLAKRQPVALFTTDTKRTRATLAPLAAALKLEPKTYDPKRGRDLADMVLKDYAGKSVVIVGHSNTVLSLIDDFGGIPPVDEIRDNEYDYLFVVRVAPGMQPTVETRGYGAERREPVASRLQKTKEKEMKIQAKAQAKAVK